jgi:hypothetical protein
MRGRGRERERERVSWFQKREVGRREKTHGKKPVGKQNMPEIGGKTTRKKTPWEKKRGKKNIYRLHPSS